MLYLFTALYPEAKGLIQQFRLRKNTEQTVWQEFDREQADLRLVITGAGEVAAAAAVGGVCMRYRPNREDILLNVGTCARAGGCAGIFLCHKIIEQATGKTFYPDMIYRHDFGEGTVTTGMRPWGGQASDPEGMLYDMEAAAVYQAGSHFFGPHQMQFIKLVSDDGGTERMTKEQIEHCMAWHAELLSAWVDRMAGLGKKRNTECRESENEERWLANLSKDLHCSKTMQNSLRGLLHYLTLAGVDYSVMLQSMYREGLLPCHDKREGKQRLEELRNRLF